ncbi:MAG TPA: preprotein translocase subunit SecY [Verrucomicrobiae bacterium]|jgi:preprotein translocase subunit SecY|nr:preprotein translocase subunit SecY [Verrucomicrobiae bacterium]
MLASIVNTFSNCFKIPELKSRIGFTFMLLAICRLAAFIRIPSIDGAALSAYLASHAAGSGGLLNMYSLFTGGALENCAVGALGIMPYISATIVMQLLTAVVPTLSKLAREEGGRVKIIKYSRYLTVLLCIGQGYFMAYSWENPQTIFGGWNQGPLVLSDNIWWYRIETVLILTTGTLLLMWLGEQITERGIGNGISLVITIGILARLPAAFQGLADMYFSPAGKGNFGNGIVLVALLIAVVAGVIAVTQAQRKIPVQYAQRAVGRKVYSGGTSFLPLRLNFAGVMPIIFAQAILMVPQKLFTMIGSNFPSFAFLGKIGNALNYGAMTYLVVYTLMILFFSYFWTATQFNELQIADDLKKNGGYIPGVRPGQATSNYLHSAMTRITLAGAIFLTVIAVIPIVLTTHMNVPPAVGQYFGGTSMLILVGVLLDTMRQMESHLMMRHYDGFLKGGRSGGSRLRGRF